MRKVSGFSFIDSQIAPALSGEDFFCFREAHPDDKLEFKGIPPEVANGWFQDFHFFQNFGLPHGKGWLDETEGTLLIFSELKTVLEVYKATKEAEAWKKKP